MSVLLRLLDGMDGMEGMEGSDGKLPDGVYHAVSCKTYRDISYENTWMLPFLVALIVLAPWGWLLRMDGIRDGDVPKKKKGYRILGVCFFIGLIFLVFEDGKNLSPVDQIPYSNKIVYGCFITIVPIYLFLRDSGVLCPSGATCCGRRGGMAETFCMAMGEFWDYGMMAICSVGVPVCGLWSTMACHDVQIELGHWVPFLGFLAYGGILLYFSGPARRDSLNLQYAEGWCWIAWGVVFNVYFMPGSGGGLFYRFFHNGESSPRWAPDQQHIFQALFYIFIGALGILLGKVGIKTGFHIALLGWAMYSMLGMHPQYCLLARNMHRLAGELFMAVGLLRFFHRIVEASLLMTILSGAFVFSSSCTVTWADANFEAISFVTFVLMLWGSWWAYVAYLFKDHWDVPLEGELPIVANGGGANHTKKYAAVNPATDDDALENGN